MFVTQHTKSLQAIDFPMHRDVRKLLPICVVHGPRLQSTRAVKYVVLASTSAHTCITSAFIKRRTIFLTVLSNPLRLCL